MNLTRFNLFLPEKREFFLEGRGLFDFGRGGGGGGGGDFGGGGGGGGSDTPSLFYTRRIGLNRGRVVPIDVGGRLTGKIGVVTASQSPVCLGDGPVAGPSPNAQHLVRVVDSRIRCRSVVRAVSHRRSSLYTRPRTGGTT